MGFYKARGIILSQRQGDGKQKSQAGGSGRRQGAWKRRRKTPRRFFKAYMQVIYQGEDSEGEGRQAGRRKLDGTTQ